jgi:predicted Zn-dependent peptidase
MYELSTLDNGLRVLTVTMPQLQSVSLGFFLRVGSRYESEALAGASHFIEHMLFKGTSQRPTAREIAKAIEGKGGIFNASTGLETTLYWAKVAAPNLQEALDVLSDMLLNAAFNSEEIEKERSVISEEINYSLNMPDSLVQILVNRLQWPDHPLGRDVAGSQESVARLERRTLLTYLSDHYRPGETILAVAGRAEHQEVLDWAKSRLSGWKPGPRVGYEAAPNLDGRQGPWLHIEFKDTDQAQTSLSFAGLSRQDPNRFALRLLNIVLGEGMTSRLFQEVRERLGMAYNVGSYYTGLQDTGAVGVYAGVAIHRAEEAIGAILGQLDRLRQEPISDDELSAAREFIRGRLSLSLEDSFALAAWYARQELQEMETLEPEEAMAYIEAVRPADIQRLAQDLFRLERLNLAVVGPFSDDGTRFRQTVLF